jgi:hypothetical protein
VAFAGSGSPDAAERLRRSLAPPVALLASVVGASCVLNLVAVARSLNELSSVDARFVGWVGIGAFTAIAVAAAVFLAADRVGAGPFLSLGAVAAVFGLSLARHVNSSEQLTLAIMVCAVASGALLAGGSGLTSTLPRAWAKASLVAWAGPLVVIWPLVTAATRRAGQLPDLVVHPPVWALAVVTVAIVSWSVVTMLVEPLSENTRAGAPWEDPWSAALMLCAVAVLLTTLLGFAPQVSLVWLRPVVVTATAAVVAGWGFAAYVIPGLRVRLGYVAVSAVAWIVPATTSFAVDVAGVDGGIGLPIVVLLVVLASAGAAIGGQGRSAVIPVGLALTAVASVATWTMSAEPWVMVTAIGPLVAFATAVLVTGVLIVATDPHAIRLIGLAVIASLVLGSVVAIPLDWALLGDVPGNSGDAIASGRLDAGLSVAVASAAAAWTWVASRRLSRRETAAQSLDRAGHDSVVDR